MIFERKFVLASRGLALVGVLSLAVTREVGLVYVALAIASLAWTAGRAWQRRDFAVDGMFANLATFAAMALIFTPVVLQGDAPIRAIAEFLLVLTSLRALAARANRDWYQVYALSFFQLVAASALTVEPAFAVLFVVYLLLAPWALVLFLLRREVTEAGQDHRLVEEAFVDPSLFRGVATVTIVLFVSTVLVFIFFPRMGAGFFANPLATGGGLTGFSDEVGLGDVTALKGDETIAMRVTLDRPDRVPTPRRYFRGAALDSFDGRRWRRQQQELRPVVKAGPGVFLTREPAHRDTVVNQEVILEPMENPAIFFLGTPLQIEGRFATMMIDALGNLRVVGSAGTRMRYDVLSTLGPRLEAPTARSRKVPAIDRRIRTLAESIVSALDDDADKANALLDYFRRGFTYTMTPGDPGGEDPIAWFLFATRQGHCEYFASSLAVMLRTVGIPSLVVNGYFGGEWNSYGGYLVLRQSDAHSWVEAFLDGEWKILDPTPPSDALESPTPFSGLAALLDAYRMRWYRYVVNYNLQDQVDIAYSIRDSSRRLWRGFSRDFWQEAWNRWQTAPSRETSSRTGLLVVLAIFALCVWVWARMRTRRAPAPENWATLRYLSLLRVLEQRGLRKRPAETPDDFYRKIAPDLDGDRRLVERLTELYQEARFSGSESPRRRAEIEALLGDLERRE